MDYAAFKKEIVRMISEKLGEDYHVRVFQVRKNNDIVLDNLSIVRKEDTISPCIYLQYYYARRRGGASMDRIADEMIEYYQRSMPAHFSPEKFLNDESVRTHVVCRLVNTERNSDLLQECPHMSFLNLSVIFYLLFDDEEIGAGAIVLRYDHLETMKLKEEELLPLALENMKRLLPADLVTMDQLIRELKAQAERQEHGKSKSEQEEENEGEEEDEKSLPMYVLTNSRRSFGAVWMMDHETLDRISEKLGDDFYVLPSSVHECMILPAGAGGNEEALARMVEEINATQVAPEEVLADNVYLYDRKTGQLQIAA